MMEVSESEEDMFHRDARRVETSSIVPNQNDHGNSYSKASKTGRTPLSVMSSSLKERLKKCGRYHPATPPSSAQTRSVLPSRQQNSSAQQQQMPSSKRSTALVNESVLQTPPASTNVERKKTLQPRNILRKRFSSVSLCPDSSKSVEELRTNSEEDIACAVNIRQERTEELKTGVKKDEFAEHDQVSCSPLPVTVRRAENKGQNDAISPTHQNPSSTKMDQAVSETDMVGMTDLQLGDLSMLMITKQEKSARLVERKEVLRKLNMVKTYRSKNNLHQLQILIDKWRSACQQAVLDLHQLTPEPRPSLTELVEQLGLEKELLCYNEEEECFETP